MFKNQVQKSILWTKDFKNQVQINLSPTVCTTFSYLEINKWICGIIIFEVIDTAQRFQTYDFTQKSNYK